jgi:hypothetical protein
VTPAGDGGAADGGGGGAGRLGGLRRWALRLEAALDRVRPAGRGTPVIDPDIGYATPDGPILRGRSLTALRRTRPAPAARHDLSAATR